MNAFAPLLLLLGSHAVAALTGTGATIVGLRAPAAAAPRCGGAVVAQLDWEDLHGCKVLRPSSSPPRAMVHFLGGVFVSPAPQAAYKYLLESLADRGFLVVATPFAVDFNYRKPAAEVHAKFLAAEKSLADEYGELSLLAAGHSLGALMQVLLCTEYPDYGERACAAALVSYNNKPASDAIPLFEQAFVPAFAPLEPLTRNPALANARSAAVVLRQAAFGLTRGAARRGATELGGSSSGAIKSLAEEVDASLRDAESLAALADQIPDVLGQIAQGASEFSPNPTEVKALVHAKYKQQKPLIISFEVDGLDESDALEAALPDAAGATRARLPGTHLTPLAARRLLVPPALRPPNLLFDVDGLVDEMDRYYTKALEELPARQEAARQEAREEERRRAEEEAAREGEAARVARAANVEAQVSEKLAKQRLEEAARSKAAARREEAVALVTSGIVNGGVVVPTAQVLEAKEAVREAENAEEEARQAANIAAVESRIAEIESAVDEAAGPGGR